MIELSRSTCYRVIHLSITLQPATCNKVIPLLFWIPATFSLPPYPLVIPLSFVNSFDINENYILNTLLHVHSHFSFALKEGKHRLAWSGIILGFHLRKIACAFKEKRIMLAFYLVANDLFIWKMGFHLALFSSVHS